MEIESNNQSVFAPVSGAFAANICNQAIVTQNFFTEHVASSNQLILTLTKKHILARSSSSLQSESMYFVDICFDLKFQIIYEDDKKVHSKKIGIKFLVSNNEFNTFYTSDTATIESWTHHLSKIINQRGFHELFKPIKKLGKGNFASVYQVQRVTDLNRFAVKAFSKLNTFAAKNGKESLINELSVMRSMNHSNVLRLECVFESDNSIYVVLEVLSGGQLFHKIQKVLFYLIHSQSKGNFSKHEIKEFLKGLLSGLAHMHQNRIMHRDLKPENIMLRNQKSMDPVIVDFGLATNCDIKKYLFYRCGTPGYVAPQIVTLTENIHIQPQCDVFSAGVIFHIMLLRKPLFEGTQYDQVYKNNKQMKFDLNSSAYLKLDPQELSLLKKMLAHNPKDRITAAEALNHHYFREEIFPEQKQLLSPQLTNVTEKMPKIGKLLKF